MREDNGKKSFLKRKSFFVFTPNPLLSPQNKNLPTPPLSSPLPIFSFSAGNKNFSYDCCIRKRLKMIESIQ